jgi:type IV pilus assembly protein PilM
MVDWRKDIKLSDLLARDKGEEEVEEAKPFHQEPPRFEPEAEAKPFHEPAPPDEDPVAAEPEPPEAEDAEETSFWKREIKFGRRGESESDRDFDTPSEDAERRPFFKRELSFRRTQDDVGSDPDVDALEQESEQTPFWKRELGFGHRHDEAVEEAAVDAVEPEHAQPERDAAAFSEADSTEDTPFWKRELSFGRRRDEAVEETPVDAVEPEHEPPEPDAAAFSEADSTEDTPFWKRELSFRRTQDEVGPDPDVDAPEQESEQTPFWKRELSFGRRRDEAVEETPVDAVSEHEQPKPDAASFADADGDGDEDTPFWKRELSFRRSKDPDFDAPEAEERPFFKRELSFGRRKDDADFETSSAESEAGTFFKRGFSLRRSRQPAFDTSEDVPKTKPFFKRELSFRRGQRGAAEVTAGRAARGGRKKQLVGLKVGASQIAAARIVNNGSPELLQLARQPIEQGIVVGGELRDPDALADALRDFFARHKLPNRNVRLGIGNNRIGVRSFEISGVHDPKQLENAIRFRAQEALPIPLDEAVLDYHVIGETVSPTGIRTYDVQLVVAYRELIDRYVAACRGAGVRLVGIDLEAFALLRALSPPASEGFPEDTALVAISIGHDRSTFAVSNGTVCEFTRVLDWGGSSLNTAIARALDVTPSQAEPVKRTLSLGEREGSAAAQSNEHTAMAEEAVRLELQSFARELVSSLHFYQNQPGSLAIGTIVLTGGTAHMPGLAAELQRLIGVKVRVGDPLRRLKTAKHVEAPDQVGSMAVAIGLGIED